ncbi:hypothetical protein ACVI1J_009672 [Bradyrhizobium diazoefficiens]
MSSGKISGDPDKSLDGTEKLAAAAGGANWGIVLNTIAAWLASKTQTLISKSIDAANNTISNLTLTMFAGGVVDTDGTLAANSDARVATQKAVKTYIDAVAQGLDPKPSVKAATTANITLSGAQTIDGVALGAGDLCLVKDQSTASQNGAYVVAAGAWTRTPTMDAWSEVPGAYMFVEQGTLNGDTGWVCTSDQGGTIGATAISFVKFTVAGGVTSIAGNTGAFSLAAGITNSGNQLQIDGEFGFRNRILNPSGEVQTTGLGSTADGAYCGFDGFIALTQSNPVTSSQVTNAENGTPSMMRLTQANASAQRFGLIQFLVNEDCNDWRGQTVCLSARVRMSVSTTLRYAILEWTGTADAFTKDVVNNWTSGTFTAGNFFISSNLTVTATGSIVLTANVLTDITPLATALGSSGNNVAVFFWTDSAQAQTVTLDIAKVQLEQGSTSTRHARLPRAVQVARCQRFCYQMAPPARGLVATTTTVSRLGCQHPTPMFKVPTVTVVGSPGVTDGSAAAVVGSPSNNYSTAAAFEIDAPLSTGTLTAGKIAMIYQGSAGSFLVDARP